MWKILSFQVLVAILCATYMGYSNTGEISLDWSFMQPEFQNFEK